MRSAYWLMLLAVLVIGSGMSVIYVKHQSRVLFSELRELQRRQDEEMIQWSRLQLQMGTLLTQANVEKTARRKLDMVLPEDIRMIRLPARKQTRGETRKQ
jgi:cell division protein FtsL